MHRQIFSWQNVVCTKLWFSVEKDADTVVYIASGTENMRKQSQQKQQGTACINGAKRLCESICNKKVRTVQRKLYRTGCF